MKGVIQKVGQNPAILSIIVATFIFLLLLLIGGSLRAGNIHFQYWFAALKNSIPYERVVNEKIIVVEIDNATLNKPGFGFPMDRSRYAPVINNLTQAGASVIGIDIIFEDESNNKSDRDFAEAIEQSGKVLLGFSSIESKPGPILSILKQNIVATGFFDVPIDNVGGVQKITPIKTLRDKKTYSYFPISILQQSNVGDINIPQEDMIVNFLPRQEFTRVSFATIGDKDQLNIISKQINFEDAIVLIGMTADGTKDIFKTPNGQEYGVYIHANTINTLLQGYHLDYFNPFVERVLLFLCLLLGAFLNFKRYGWGLITSNLAVATIFILILQAVILLGTDLLPNYYIEFFWGLILTLVISNILKYVFENKDKKKLNKALGEYVSQEVSDEILNGKGNVNFDGEKKQIAMFFSDIEGFTSISEKFTPEKLVYFLREYLGDMSHVIMNQRGFINKYEGDAIMALWGAFGKNDDIVYNACLSALNQQKALSELNKKWTKSGDFDPLRVRMGIHVGEAILGNIGAEGKKLEFTALGDNVNLASRLEGINKYYNTYMCVSEDVYNVVKDNFDFRYLDNIRVKGKNKPVKIYELLSLKGKTIAEHRSIIDEFNKAIQLYYRQDFTAALGIFVKLSGLGDGPSKTYTQRTQYFIENPPSDNWDQIWTFSTK